MVNSRMICPPENNFRQPVNSAHTSPARHSLLAVALLFALNFQGGCSSFYTAPAVVPAEVAVSPADSTALLPYKPLLNAAPIKIAVGAIYCYLTFCYY